MDEREVFEVLKKQLCREIAQLTEQVNKNQSMSGSDLDKLDKMFHLKKSLLTCKAMEESDGEDWEEGNSGRRGRSPSTGRYVSREQSYADGYSQGFSEAMSQMNSGHGPMAPYPQRHW